MKFFNSQHCLTNSHCYTCRNKDDKEWRKSLMRVFDDIKKVDFKCPHNKEWGMKERIRLKADGSVIRNGEPCKSCSEKK